MDVDGGGNLIANDGKLFAPICLWFGRDLQYGHNYWAFEIGWGLDNSVKIGQRVYRRTWGFRISRII